MKEKKIYLVIHGEIFSQVPNSGLTSTGIKQMELIKNNLTIYPSLVISGTEKETSAVC